MKWLLIRPNGPAICIQCCARRYNGTISMCCFIIQGIIYLFIYLVVFKVSKESLLTNVWLEIALERAVFEAAAVND